jgi:hypothetical protein
METQLNTSQKDNPTKWKLWEEQTNDAKLEMGKGK